MSVVVVNRMSSLAGVSLLIASFAVQHALAQYNSHPNYEAVGGYGGSVGGRGGYGGGGGGDYGREEYSAEGYDYGADERPKVKLGIRLRIPAFKFELPRFSLPKITVSAKIRQPDRPRVITLPEINLDTSSKIEKPNGHGGGGGGYSTSASNYQSYGGEGGGYGHYNQQEKTQTFSFSTHEDSPSNGYSAGNIGHTYANNNYRQPMQSMNAHGYMGSPAKMNGQHHQKPYAMGYPFEQHRQQQMSPAAHYSASQERPVYSAPMWPSRAIDYSGQSVAGTRVPVYYVQQFQQNLQENSQNQKHKMKLDDTMTYSQNHNNNPELGFNVPVVMDSASNGIVGNK